jgi:Leucine-rich repeat (LRR) protein
MIELRELNLSNNLFTSIPIDVIISMPKLEQLVLSNNPINNLEKELEILSSKNIKLNIIA